MELNGAYTTAMGSLNPITDVVIESENSMFQYERQEKYFYNISWCRTKSRILTTLEKALLLILCVLILTIIVIAAQNASSPITKCESIYSEPPQTDSITNLKKESSTVRTTITPNGLESKQQPDTKETDGERSRVCTTSACVITSAAILSAMDTSVDPCQDFYRYSCGHWSLRNPASRAITQIESMVQIELKNSLESTEETADDVESEAEQTARRFYQSCLNFNVSNKEPLLDLLDQIGGWPALGGYYLNETNYTGSFQKNLQLAHDLGGNAFFKWSVQKPNTFEHPALTRDVPFILMEPNILTTGWTSRFELQEVSSVLTKAPIFLLHMRMRNAINVEMQIKQTIIFHSNKGNDTDVNSSSVDVLTISELQTELPFLNWLEFFNSIFSQVDISIPASQPVALSSLALFRNLSSVISKVLESDDGQVTLQNYLAWNAIRPYIPKYLMPRSSIRWIPDLDDEKPWRKCVDIVTDEMGYAAVAMYVRQIMRDDTSIKLAESKQLAESMLTSVKEAFKRNLKNLDWIDAETRDAVEEKIGNMSDIVGYPKFILNPVELDDFYGGLVIQSDEFISNLIRIKQFMFRTELAVLNQSKNVAKFFDHEKSPSLVTVNAMYIPSQNRIILPATILQEPLFHVSLPAAANFGGMGSIIGREVTHGFDRTRQGINQSGKLRNWWSNVTVSRFQERAACLVKQYSSYNISDRSIDGDRTLNENVADNGGVKAAFNAFTEWRNSRKEDNSFLPGLNVTQSQLFFLSYANAWCSNTSKTSLYRYLGQYLSHSPDYYRVIGSLSNMREFSSAFQCKPGTQMNPIKKCEVW